MVKYGISDMPISESGEDFLETSSYINGLVEFVKECTTPMSIALQGDLGTGKTSFINSMKEILDRTKEHKTIYFNTWQYSHFNMSDDLYTSFILSINNAIEGLSKIDKSKVENVKSVLKGMAFSKFKQLVNNYTGTDLDKLVEAVVNNDQQRREAVAKLKKTFSELVENAADGHNMIIFVDDLDRLEPKIAVELLEVMKLFMDVKDCVFVLAIDYDVVVKGIRGKYGNDMSDEKCRSFFDKIIQLPFRMPVENYKISKMIANTFGTDFNNYNSIIVTLILNTLGPNPRTFKRLYNSYELLTIVNKQRSDGGVLKPYQKVLILTGLIIQMASNSDYAKLMSASEDAASMKEYLESFDGNDTVMDNLNHALLKIGKAAAEDKEMEKKSIYDEFYSLLALTSITSVSVAPNMRKEAIKPTMISVYGEMIPVSTAKDAIVKTFETLLNKSSSKISSFMHSSQCNMLTDDENKLKKSIYRAYHTLNLKGSDLKLYLGTSTGFNTKTDQADRLCSFLKLPPDTVIWYDEDTKIYSNK